MVLAGLKELASLVFAEKPVGQVLVEFGKVKMVLVLRLVVFELQSMESLSLD